MRKLIVVTVALTLALAACGSSTDASLSTAADFGDEAVGAPAEAERFREEASDAGSDVGFDSPLAELPAVPAAEFQVLEDRKVIRNANLTLEAEDPQALAKAVATLAEATGGYVASSEMFRFESDDLVEIFLTLRIPARAMATTLERMEQMASRVLERSLGSQDVTAEYTDIEAQLRNLIRLEEELVALLTDVRERPNADASDLLVVFDRISEVRSQIERLAGRQQLLDDLVDLATISVQIVPVRSVNIVDEDGWAPGQVVRSALRGLVIALQAVANVLIWVGLFILPILIVAAIPLAALIWYRRRSKDENAPGAAEAVDNDASGEGPSAESDS